MSGGATPLGPCDVAELEAAANALVGAVVTYRAPEPLGRAAIRYFALAVGETNPIFFDLEAARRAGYPDLVAPPTLIFETNQYVGIPPDPDGHAGHRWDLPTDGVRLVRGGNHYRLGRATFATDVLEVSWKLEGVERKTPPGRAPMLLVRSLQTVRSGGELLGTNAETLIYQVLAQ